MTLVNCTVVSSSNKIVYPWKITVGDDKVSITEFYVNNINHEIDAEQKGTLSKTVYTYVFLMFIFMSGIRHQIYILDVMNQSYTEVSRY